MERSRSGMKWWFVGCGGVLAVFAIALGVIAGLTWQATRTAEPRDTLLNYAETIPLANPPRGSAGVSPAAPDPAEGLDARAPARVLLEVDSAELIVEPAAPGETLSVDARYDAGAYRLEEQLDEGNPWSYRMRFLVTGSRLITTIKQGIHGGQPQLRVRLPLDVPMELTILQRNGGAIVDLSGLHLRGAEFDFEGALLKVDADRRLAGSLERFAVRGGSGGLVLESLDLMEPERIDVDFRMGQILIDMRGAWTADSAVELATSLADVTLRLPRDARIEGLDTSRKTEPASREIPLPTLNFVLESGKRSTLRLFE